MSSSPRRPTTSRLARRRGKAVGKVATARATPVAAKDLREARDEAVASTRAVIAVLDALGRVQTVTEAAVAALNSVRAAFGWTYGSFWLVDGEAMTFTSESGEVSDEFQQATRRARFKEGEGLVSPFDP